MLVAEVVLAPPGWLLGEVGVGDGIEGVGQLVAGPFAEGVGMIELLSGVSACGCGSGSMWMLRSQASARRVQCSSG